MTVESVTFISDLDQNRPAGSDKISLGDDHIRNVKKAIRQTFPKITGEVEVGHGELNHLAGLTQPIVDLIADGEDLEARVSANEAQIHVINGTINNGDGSGLTQQVESNAAEIEALKEEVAALAAKGGGSGMIKAITQPNTAGDFEVDAYGQNYKKNCPAGRRDYRLFVPDGKVFCFEYLYALTEGDDQAPAPTLTVPLEGVYIDGVPLYATNQYDLKYNGGGPIWPGNDKKVIVRVENMMEFKGVFNDATHPQASWRTSAYLHIAGWFTEA